MSIEFKNVEKMFTSSTGIQGINLIINDQDKIGILGPNGAGKTTLIKLMQGLILPNVGEVTKNNILTTNKKFTLENIAYISTDDIFPEKLSVKRYINFVKELNHMYQSKIDYIAEIFEFDLKQKTKIKKLSNGMKQKLKLCISLGFEKDIYIFDEPTSGLDPLMRDRFIEYIKNNFQNKTFIYCTHLVEEVTQLCNEVLILKNNTIVEKIIIGKETNLINDYKKIYEKSAKDENYLSNN